MRARSSPACFDRLERIAHAIVPGQRIALVFDQRAGRLPGRAFEQRADAIEPVAIQPERHAPFARARIAPPQRVLGPQAHLQIAKPAIEHVAAAARDDVDGDVALLVQLL